MTVRSQILLGAVGLAVLSAGGVALLGAALVSSQRSIEEPRASHEAPSEPGEGAVMFPIPSGKPTGLSCEQARVIVQQVHHSLAYEPSPIALPSFAAGAADWLDPYGLWSAAPDSPIGDVLSHEARDLLLELEDQDPASCSAAGAVSEALVRWTAQLGRRFDESRGAALRGPSGPIDATQAADAPLFEKERPATELAGLLGTRTGRLERQVGSDLSPFGAVARERFFPPFSKEGWAELVRAAALRAYLPLLDPHGAWASTDEQASIYDVDLDPRPPELLWEQGQRASLGVLVDAHPTAPLEVGDLVLSIAGVPTAGLPPEQLDQLVYATTDATIPEPIVVLRRGETALRTLTLSPPEDAPEESETVHALDAYRVPYGEGDALVVEIRDVRSDLDVELIATLHDEMEEKDAPPVLGLLLDLRGNGGGSAEGAIAMLGVLMPGVPLFPMVARDGSIEVDRASEPPVSEQWTRPVAALVDGDTASAAEMIAGALMAYRRGPVVGERTFGKGCAQEYLDDAAGVGVLRLTTLLYSLPDGSPVQRVGLTPSLLLPRGPSIMPVSHQREADEVNAPPTWRGPDVRDLSRVLPADKGAWPEHHGKVGAGSDHMVAAALRALGSGLKRAASGDIDPSHRFPPP